MECRNPLVLTVGLLALAAGCQLPEGLPASRASSPEGKAEVKHLPETYVTFGDLRAKAAFLPETAPARAQEFKEEARLAYQQAVAVDPNYAPAHLALARLYQAIEDYPRATAAYQRALELDGKEAAVWFELGICQARQKDWNGSVTSLGRATDLDRDNRQYANTLGFTLARTGRHREALEVFGRVNGPAKAHYNLARALDHGEQKELAREHLRLALIKDPRLTDAQDLLAALDSPAGTEPAVQTAAYAEVVPGGSDPRGQTGPTTIGQATGGGGGRVIPVPPLPIISIHTRPAGESN